jgi:hypothetical protein
MQDTMPPVFVWAIVGAAAVIVVVIILLNLSSRGGLTKGHISDSLLLGLERNDPLWKKQTMLDAVGQTFDTLKKSYESRTSEVQTDIMTINIYRDLFKNVIPNLEKLEFIRHTSLKKAEIIQVVTHRIDTHNSFSVRLSLEPDTDNKDLPDAVHWTFIKAGTKWLLSDISEEAIPSGYFPQGKK